MMERYNFQKRANLTTSTTQKIFGGWRGRSAIKTPKLTGPTAAQHKPFYLSGSRLQTVNKYLLRLSHNVPSQMVKSEKRIAKEILAHPGEHSAEERQAANLIVHQDRRVTSKEMMEKAVRGDMAILSGVSNPTVREHQYALEHDQTSGSRQALKKAESEFNPAPKPEPKHWTPAKRYHTSMSQPEARNSWRPGVTGWQKPGAQEASQTANSHQAWRSKAVTKSSSSSIPIQPVVPLGSSGSMLTLTGGGHITADEHQAVPSSIPPEPPPASDQDHTPPAADPNSGDKPAVPNPSDEVVIPSPTEANDPFGN